MSGPYYILTRHADMTCRAVGRSFERVTDALRWRHLHPTKDRTWIADSKKVYIPPMWRK